MHVEAVEYAHEMAQPRRTLRNVVAAGWLQQRAIAPEHRGARLAVRAMEFGERAGRAMGAGFIYGMATLKIPNMQLALERAGYQLLGFTPGYDREVVAPGVVKRVYEAVYAKVLVPDAELLRPDPANLSPKAKALFDVLFPV
jgi:hypothetical protein